jgi:hypothetical protein
MSLSVMTLTADAQQKILGPYLWMIAKTAANQGGANSTNIDSLDDASRGKVTEEKIAKNGAREGDEVGDYEWTPGTLANNGDINALVNQTGMEVGALDDITSYALIVLKTKRAQKDVAMGVSSDDSVKVWVNGEVVHTNATNRGRGGDNSFQDHLKIDLKKGNNLVMIKVSERGGGWGMHFGVGGDYDIAEIDAILPVDPVGKLTTQWAQIKSIR